MVTDALAGTAAVVAASFVPFCQKSSARSKKMGDFGAAVAAELMTIVAGLRLLTESIGFVSSLLMCCYCLCCLVTRRRPKQAQSWAPATITITNLAIASVAASRPLPMMSWVCHHQWSCLAVSVGPWTRPWSLPLCSGCSRNCRCLGESWRRSEEQHPSGHYHSSPCLVTIGPGRL